MKKLIVLMGAICFITMAATTKSPTNEFARTNSTVINEKYKACIEACKASILSSTNCEKACSKMDAKKMAKCIQLCKECVAICKASKQLMTLDSESAKAICKECVRICEKCATECEKHDVAECKKCATDCRKTAKLCNEMQ
jgi:hypothetical protein